jgi:hypothetical protein
MIAVVLGLVLTLTGPELDAAEAAKRGEDAYAGQRWLDAADAFGEAYRLDPKPAYLYARAQAERLGDRCDLAIEHYEAFLRRVSEGVAAQTARENLEACRAVLSTSQSAPVELPLKAQTGPAGSELPNEGPTPRPRRDALGPVALSVGAALLIAGTTVQAVARREQRRAEQAPNVLAYDRSISRAVRLGRASIPVLVVGGVLASLGVARVIVLARRSRTRDQTAWTLDSGGLQLQF